MTNRRQFLAGCAGCVMSSVCTAAPATPQLPKTEKVKLRLVFTHIPPDKPTWPYIGFDYEGRKKELTAKLEQACPFAQFLPATVGNPAEAKKLLLADDEVDGYIVYMLGIWTGSARVIGSWGKPTLFVDDLYGGSGEFLTAYSQAKRAGWKVAPVSTTRFGDLVEAVRAFETIKKLQASKMLDVVNRDPGENARAIREMFGTTVQTVSGEEFNDAYRRADRAEGEKWADKWVKEAEKVVEPSRAEIGNSGAMYVAMRDLMAKSNAQGIAIDCLTLYYAGKLPAYPCLGLFQFNNDGLVGACEADLQSAISMLVMSYMTGRPGYISDPVIDTSKNQIIYAHCVAPSKVFGPNGAGNPYHIRSHSEDRKGAAVRSLMPIGEMTTTLRFNPISKQVIFHQGKTVENIDDDKACRTKVAAEVSDIDKLLSEWDSWGWHRVTFYGDLKKQVDLISALTGFTVVKEG